MTLQNQQILFITIAFMLVSFSACGSQPGLGEPSQQEENSHSEITPIPTPVPQGEAKKSNCKDLLSKIKQSTQIIDNNTGNAFEPPATYKKQNNVNVVTVMAGTIFLNKQFTPIRFFDFQTGKFLDITDTPAFTTDKQWDFGIRAFEFYTNGGFYPGNVEIAKAEGKGAEFDSFSKDDAEKLKFITDSPLTKDCEVRTPLVAKKVKDKVPALAKNLATVRTAMADLNPSEDPFKNDFWFLFKPGLFVPVIQPDIYVFRDKKAKWMVKLMFTDAKKGPVIGKVTEVKKATFTFKYEFLEGAP